MSEHTDLGAYLTGRLDPEERERFERHLADCEQCREELDGMRETADLLTVAGPAFDVPEGLERRTIAALDRAIDADGATAVGARHAGPRWPRRRLLVPAIAVAAALLGVGVYAATRPDGGGNDLAGGIEELKATLRGPGGAVGEMVVRAYPSGRRISLTSDDLRQIPHTYYEMWLVGRNDRRGAPDRVSAGTFHPDPGGHTDVELSSAAHPGSRPVIEVSREPKDGNPAKTGPTVLRYVVGGQGSHRVDLYKGDPFNPDAPGHSHGG